MIPRPPRRARRYFNLSIIFFIGLAALVTVGPLALGGRAGMKEAHQAEDKDGAAGRDKASFNSGGAGKIQSGVVKVEPAPQSQQSLPPTQTVTMQDAGDGALKPYAPPTIPDWARRPSVPGSDVLELSAPRPMSGEQQMLLAQSVNVSTFTIVIDAGPGLAGNAAALAAFNAAAASWAARFTDPITVTISADLSTTSPGGGAFPPSVIGSTSAVTLQAGYSTIRDAVVNDANSSASVSDNIAASLPTAAQFIATVPAGRGLSGNIVLTKANAKALGFTGLDAPPASGGFGPSDGQMVFNSAFMFDYDRSDGIAGGTIDFQTVAEHEIGHLLGFVSQVDTIDSTSSATYPSISFTTLDLYRFASSSPPATAAAFTTAARDFIPGHEDVTGDTVAFPRMSTGVNTGDGRQASHWKDDTLIGFLIGVMDPTLSFATIEDVNETDFHAFDLIGYDVSPGLGNYPATSVALGADATITPNAAPTLASGINVSTSTNFKGTFAADPATGVVRVTNAHPAGTYTVTVTAFGGGASTSKTFTLTVQQGTACTGVITFTNSPDVVVGSGPGPMAIGDFNSDGKQDIAVSNYSSNDVSIRLGDGTGNFFGSTNVGVGSGPTLVAIGDFNSDGKQDLAVANYDSNSVSILIGDGTGSFSGSTDVSAGTNPDSVAVGDFNNDGKQDLAFANQGSSNFWIRLGDGTGSFSGSTSVGVGSSPNSIVVGDFNNDGEQDIATANRGSHTVSIRLGDGAGNFSGTTEVSASSFSGFNPISLAVGDFNNDGNQDLAATGDGSNIAICLGDGAGNFSATTIVNISGGARLAVTIGDFNNDGKQDLAAASQGLAAVAIRLGDGAGGFSGTTNVAAGLTSIAVAIGDFNNDGKQDFASADGSAPSHTTLSIRLGGCNPAPTITPASGLSRTQGSPVTNSQIAAVTDDGGNGSVGVTVTSANPSNGVTISNIVNTGGNITANIVADCTASNASFTLQASDGVSTSTATLNIAVAANTAPTLTYTNPPAVALNSSLNINPATGPSDNLSVSTIIVQSAGTYTGTISVDNTTGVVSVSNAAPAGTHTIKIRATDNCGVNTDATFTLNVQAPPALGNYPDTAVNLSGNTTITPNAAPTGTSAINVSTSTNFKGTFAAKSSTGVVRVTDAHPAGTYTVTVTAFNSPGVATIKTFQLTVQTGTACVGVPAFNNAADLNIGAPQLAAAVGDFNNDGKQDIATVDQGNMVSIRLGDGMGGFTGSTNVSVGLNPQTSLAIGDFNSDGNQDFATANLNANTVSIRLGDGTGGFTGSTEVSVGNGPTQVAVGDFNNDGKQDLAVAHLNSPSGVSIRLGDGAGGFTGSTNITVGFTVSGVVIGDFNNDGKQDFATANADSDNVSIRLGDGTGAFAGSTNISVGDRPTLVTIGDFNNDGKQDFAAANSFSDDVSIRLGDGTGGFTGSTNISVGDFPVSVAVGDFNNDGKQDFAADNFNSTTVSIRLGDGIGGFTGSTNINVGSSPYPVAIGDFNGDGNQDFVAPSGDLNTASVRLGGCNLTPTITAATGLSRQQSSAATNSQIATVADDGGNGSVVVTVTSANPSNGVTISNIVNTGGAITADIVANCAASNASFTLQAGDGSSSVTGTLNITVTANTPPALTYSSPQSIAFNGSQNISPAAASDNGSITGYAVQSVVPALTTAPTVNAGGVVSITNAQPAGDHLITISATDNCGATTVASFTLTVMKANQTINFATLANKTFGDPDFGVSATATSGLAVSFAPSGNCTVTSPSPGTVHITGAGSCTITASQAGDATYNAAPNVSQSFNIAKAATSTAVTSSANPSDFGQSVTFVATVASGAGTPAGMVQFKDNGTNLSAAVALNGSGIAQISTSALTAATHTITAEYSGDADFVLSSGTLTGGQVVRPQPSLSINDVSVTEGDAGTKVLSFTVTLSAASNLPVNVNYATANGTATVPSDYAAIASTLLIFNPGDTSKQVSVTINGDISFESDETFFLNLSNPSNATISDSQGLGTIQNDDVVGGFISFSQVNTNVNESTGILTLTVTRTNDVSQAVNVDYATDDTGAQTNCSLLNTGLASQHCDYTSMFGTLKLAANETQKTVDIPINLDAYTEGPETFTVKLSNPTGGAVLAVPSTATVTISDSASPTPNAIDDTTNFVRQQYRDFLNREADPAGLAFWKNNIDKCNDPAQRPAGQTLAACIEVQRILTSAAFFLSIEFKGTGGLVRDFYVAALDRPLTNNMPNFVEFMRDTQAIQRGVTVGQGNWQQVLDANRLAFMNEFVTRAEFVALYPTTDTPTQYVDKLYLHANVTGTQQERLDAIADFGGAATAADTAARARALLRVTQNGAFQVREANRTFVQIEYFGYLRRNPNDPPDNNFNGYNFWVGKLNQFNGDFLQAEMVKAFLSSLEYRNRFGP